MLGFFEESKFPRLSAYALIIKTQKLQVIILTVDYDYEWFIQINISYSL